MKNHFTQTLTHVSKRFFRFAGIASALAVCTTNVVYAQAYKLNQVIILNDGNRTVVPNGTYATVGSFNPSTNVYRTFDTIKGANFGSHVLIDSGYIYVGADSLLIKYDLNTKAKIATQTVPGIREMAVWGNQILVTCGATFPLTSYFQAYNKSNLKLIYQDPTVSSAAQGIQVSHDSAYIAINDFGSGTVGKIGVVDLKAQKEKHEIDLGANGLNPYEVEIEPASQEMFTVNDLNWTNSTVTQYTPSSATFADYSLNLTSGCTGSVYYQGNIYFQAGNDANIGLYNTTSHKVWDSLKINKYIYGMGIDSADGYIYLGQTDYATYGSVLVYDLFGNLKDSIPVDVGPGNFAFDMRSTTGVAPSVAAITNLQVYPNPSNGEVHVNFTGTYKGTASLFMTDVLGRVVYQSQVNTGSPIVLSVSGLTNGVYFLTMETPVGKSVQKIVKN